MRSTSLTTIVLLAAGLTARDDDPDPADSGPPDAASGHDTGVALTGCQAEPEVLTTAAGVEFVRTPDECFEDLPDWPYAPQYVEIDGLRQAYVDEGPADGPVVLLLHGQPSWSYLYRHMIPGLAEAGYRVIAMDHLGMGRSDKPTDIAAYSYLGHHDRLAAFVEALDLRDIHVRAAVDAGALIAINTDAHGPADFGQLRYGVLTARRGWLPAKQCINTWSEKKLRAWLDRS